MMTYYRNNRDLAIKKHIINMQKPSKPGPTFWITNISNRDVALSDLNISIKSMTSVNLLNEGHYSHLTLEMLQKSAESGSLFKKRDKLVHRKVPPYVSPKNNMHSIQRDPAAVMPTRQHSILEIKEEKYDELNIIDDEAIDKMTNDPTIKSE